MIGKWDYSKADQMCYSDETSYLKAREFLGDEVEDWGCGTGWASQYFKNYRGIDGSSSKNIPEENIVDLSNYVSSVDNILIRLVLECCGDWRKVLENAIQSFSNKLCIVISTPFSDTTHIGNKTYLVDGDNNVSKEYIEEVFFNKQDILDYFPLDKFILKEETIDIDFNYGKEWILYVEKINS